MPKSYKPPRIFHLRSQDSTTVALAPYEKSDLYFNIDQNLTPQADEALVVSINTAEIPISFYPVGVNNNTFGFKESTDATAGSLVAKNNIVLTSGNYTATGLATEIARAINASNGGNDYSCIFDSTITKFAISKLNTAAELTYQFDFKIATSGTAYKLLGFTASFVYPAQVGVTNVHLLTSSIIANVGGDNSLYIRSPLSNINSYESKHGGASDILAKIPLTVQYNEIQHYSPVANMFKSQLPNGQALNDLSIRLTNSDNLLIDMNGMDWELSVVVETIKITKDYKQ